MRYVSHACPFLGLLAIALLASTTTACSSSGGGASSGSAGTAGDAGAEAGGKSAGKGGTSGKGGTAGGSIGGGTSSCIASTGVDVPDAEGIDSNCDGIDGDVKSSVFVHPSGLDSAAGTKDDPVRTVSKAVQLVQASSGRLTDVLICEGKYPENVSIGDQPVGLHGGYDCADFSRTVTKPTIAPPSGVAMRIAKVSGPMHVDQITFQSADALATGESSQAVQIVSSSGISLTRAIILAGRGAAGAAGELQVKTWNGSKQAAIAARGASVTFGTDNSLGCHYGAVTTDVDFDGKIDSGPDQSLARCVTPAQGGETDTIYCEANGTKYAVKGGKGGSSAIKPYGVAPIANANGATGTPSAAPAAVVMGNPGGEFGSVSDLGYLPSNAGTDGLDGLPGYSGLGGLGGGACLVRQGNVDTTDALVTGMGDVRAGYTCAATTTWGVEPWTSVSKTGSGRIVTMFPGSGGGQGGFGGCGGFKGFHGSAGGGSIGLLLFDSEVELAWVDISTSAGGNGGAASDGTLGQLGGDAGWGGWVLSPGGTLPTINGSLLFTESNLLGHAGTSGGPGQNGGAGGPGGGGPSIAVLWQGGTEPMIDSTVTLKSGNGGKGGTPIAGNPGADGRSSDIYNP